MRKVFKDTKVLRLLDAIIDVFHEGIDDEGNEIGVAIGINLSQLMAILVNMPILREINERLKFPSVNFTDDMFIAMPTKKDCHEFIDWYIPRCAERGMKVKPNYRIAPMREPLHMIGYEFRLDENGNEYTLLGKPIKMRMKRRARQLERMNVDDEYWKQQMASYFGWCKHARCRNLMRKTFGERYKLFKKNMQTFKDIKGSEVGEFGIPKKDRVSVTALEGVVICFDDAQIVQIKSVDEKTGEEVTKEKLAVKFRYAATDKDGNNEPTGASLYFISGSPSLRDRLLKVRSSMPFIGTIVKHGNRKKYYAIE